MKSIDLVKMAGGNLIRRKLRTSLTVLGIVIGSISIILMIALGLGLRDSISSELGGFTSVNVIQVYKGSNVSSRARLAEVESFERLDDLDLEFFENIEGVDFASPSLQSYAKIVSGQYELTSSVIGVKPEVMSSLGFTVDQGQLLDQGQLNNGVFGKGAIDNFKQVFANNNQLLRQVEEDETEEAGFTGSIFGLPQVSDDFNVDVFVDRMQMTLDTAYSVQGGNTVTKHRIYPVSAIGILKAGDATQDNNIYMNYDFVEEMTNDYYRELGFKVRKGYDSAYVKVGNIEDVKAIIKVIESKGYQTFAIATILDSIESVLQTMQVALGAIGGISLLVAAIGITNTMVMAITERKKEIGVMKVIGATLKDIKRLFLLEAAMIGGIGGLIGIVISIGISQLISSPIFSQMISGGTETGESLFKFGIPPWLVATGLGFTTAVGIISGYMPALKAMRSSALEALRNE